MTVKISEHADEDIIAIFLRGIALFGHDQAEKYHDGLQAIFNLLADFPRSARERSEIHPAVRIQPYKSHIIVYELVEDDVLILRVRHGHEDW